MDSRFYDGSDIRTNLLVGLTTHPRRIRRAESNYGRIYKFIDITDEIG